MTERQGWLDEAIGRVRGAGVPGRNDDRLIATAMLAGAARHRRRARARLALGATGVLALAAAALLAFVGDRGGAPIARTGAASESGAGTGSESGAGTGAGTGSELLAIELVSGDAISAVPGAAFHVESDSGGVRRLRLDHGAMLFDVVALGPGERFEVVTSDATVSVVGTVFAVEASARGTAVHVFEGRVGITDRHGARSLDAGETFARERSDGGLARLAARGDAAARRRQRAGALVTAPSVAPAAALQPGDHAARSAAPTQAAAVEPAGAIERSPREASTPSRSGPATGARAAGRDRAPLVPDTVRAWIGEGRADEALDAAREHEGGDWRFVEADALRALRRWDDAAVAYERAAAQLGPAERAQTGYLASSLRARELGDPRAAIATLDALEVDHPGSPMRERGLALRARALDALGDAPALAATAAAYLAEFPHGSHAEWLRTRVSTPR